MNPLRVIAAALLALLPVATSASDAYLSMIYTNAMDKSLPFDIFTKGEWAPDPNGRFVKLHMYFDEPIKIKGIEIDSCGTLKHDDLSIFFNFDQWLLSLTPRGEGEIPAALYPKHRGDLLVLDGFRGPLEVRSLTFNFEHNSGFKICDIRLLDEGGQPYRVKTPRRVSGSVSADSVLKPASAYDPLYLFDSRFEYGWASDKKEKGISLQLDFDVPQRVEKVRLWNGYQRSVTHYIANSRATKLLLSGDGGYRAEVSVSDQLGSQVVTLPTPFTGRQLKMTVADAERGKHYRDLVLSEMRLFDGSEWFMLDPYARLHDAVEGNRKAFATASVDALLNDSYTAVRESEEESYVSSTLRLRADGSLYISGYLDEAEYFALGNYEVKKASADGLKLRLFGLYYETEVYGDCNSCGRDCNKPALPEPDPNQKIFQEIVTIRWLEGGKYELVNQSGGKKLKFDRLVYMRQR
ncbi:MAG: discoidin domain-containing protein [Chromatiales bacterium]|nr:discoidin domain-containing protein [Chromatiales bacterium]